MTLTALYEWFAQDCAQAAGQTEDPKIVKCCSSWQSSGCSTHDGAPPKIVDVADDAEHGFRHPSVIRAVAS